MRNTVVVDCVRTPIGRAHPERGYYRHVRSDDLAVSCIRALTERSGIDPTAIEDVILGNTQQTMEQGLNVARNVALMAGLPAGNRWRHDQSAVRQQLAGAESRHARHHGWL